MTCKFLELKGISVFVLGFLSAHPQPSTYQYMRRMYGDSFERTFTLVQMNGTPAYQAKGTGSSRTIFAETRNDLVQIVAAIATSPGKFSERQAQVEQILGSLQLK